MKTAKDVARWMVDELDRMGTLDQAQAAWDIERLFGSEFVYQNQNGNSAISKEVLKEFRELTPNVVWDRSYREWRKRQASDGKGRMVE